MTEPIWEWPKEHRGLIESQFYLQASNITTRSPYTGQVVPYETGFKQWNAKVVFPAKKGPDHRFLSGLITRLRGQAGKIRMVDYYRMRCGYDQEELNRQKKFPANEPWSDDSYWDDGSGWTDGFLPPFVTVDEVAAEGDRDVVLRSLPASIANVLRTGDLIEFRPNGFKQPFGMLHEIVRNTRSNASGKARIYFEPGLRMGLNAGDMAVLRNPSSVFRLASDSEGIIQRSLGNIGNLGLTLVEVLPE